MREQRVEVPPFPTKFLAGALALVGIAVADRVDRQKHLPPTWGDPSEALTLKTGGEKLLHPLENPVSSRTEESHRQRRKLESEPRVFKLLSSGAGAAAKEFQPGEPDG